MRTLDDTLREIVEEEVNASVRMTLDAVAAGFEELARDDVDGESGTVTYRQVIGALRGVSIPPFRATR